MIKVRKIVGLWLTLSTASGFQSVVQTAMKRDTTSSSQIFSVYSNDNENIKVTDSGLLIDRRSMLSSSTKSFFAAALIASSSSNANAAVGSLPELSDTNAVFQGVTIDVADLSQQDSMIAFLQGGLNFKVLRQRRVGSVTDTVSSMKQYSMVFIPI